MELTCFNKTGDYVGSIHVATSDGIPDVVMECHGTTHIAYVRAERPGGIRAGGIPRYVQASSVVTSGLHVVEERATPTPKKKKR
ncbi:MAG: hypothetical protein ACRD3G_12105 [Vicinamibacterales bacterium]